MPSITFNELSDIALYKFSIGGNINALVARAHTYKNVDADALRYELYNLHKLEKEIARHYAHGKE